MNREDLIKELYEGVKEGRISFDEVTEAFKKEEKEVSMEVINTSVILHSFFCKKMHGISKDDCVFYSNAPAIHKDKVYWVSLVEQYKTTHSFNDQEIFKVTSLFAEVISLLEKRMPTSNIEQWRYVIELLDLYVNKKSEIVETAADIGTEVDPLSNRFSAPIALLGEVTSFLD